MAGYVSNRFDNNQKAKDLALRINRLGPWLYKDQIINKDGSVEEGLGMQSVIDGKLNPLKTNIPQKNIENYKRGVELLKSSGNYPEWKLNNFYKSLKYKKLVYVDGEWHFVNKLNTNWSDVTDLLVDLFIKGNQLENISTISNLKSFLLKNKKYLSRLLDKYFKGVHQYLEYTKNTEIRSVEGEESEDVIEGFLTENGFTIEYRGGNGDFIDMIFGADIIVKHPKHGLKVVQVKKSGPYWGSLGKYNVDWIGIGDGVKIYDKNTKEDITNTLIEDKGDEMVESFFDTGKLINEIGDEETMTKLKKDFLKTEKKTFDDLVNNYEIGYYMNQFKDTYERQKKDFVYDKDNPKLQITTLNIIWEEIFKLVQNLYVLNIYKNRGRVSSGEKRTGSYGGVTSSIVNIMEKSINNGKTDVLIRLLSKLNNHIENLTTNEVLVPKLRNDLWTIIDKKLKGQTGSDILSLLSKKVSSFLEYENSFLKKGFTKPLEKKSEGRIHDLKRGELSNMINSESTEEDIFNYIKDNIQKYVSSVDNIEKFDIISDRDFMLDDKPIINSGDKIEIKKNKHSEGHDSYYSEPLASPVKDTKSNIRTDIVLKQKYTNVIDKLYNWLGGAGKNVGEDIVKKIIKGTKGIFLDEYIFIPIENIEFYLSNKGYNNCKNHRRLSIRYRLKPGKPIYKLTDDNNLEEIPYSSEKEVSKDYITCGGEKPKVIIDGSQIIKENSDFISEYVENFLDL